MCDYSLMAYRNRLARAGEDLEIHRFPSGTMGFASSCDLQAALERSRVGKTWKERLRDWFSETPGRNSIPAVCIPPGATLQLTAIPRRLQGWWGVGEVETVTFVQSAPKEYMHRDAIRFGSGRLVSLQCIPCGLKARVLSVVPAEERGTAPAELFVTQSLDG